MNKIVLKIDGMKCPMCETRVNDYIRKKFTVKKVSSSHKKGETVIITDEFISNDDLHVVLDPTGYRILGVERRKVEKKLCFYKEI